MIRISLILGAVMLLPGCQFIPGTDPYKIKKAEKSVADDLFDPTATQFRDVRLGRRSEAICGEVNGKNRMGAYVGFTRFVSFTQFSLAYMDTGTKQADVDGVYCSDNSSVCPARDDKIGELVQQQMFDKHWKEICS